MTQRAIVTFGAALLIGASAASAQAPQQRPPATFPMYLQGQYCG